MAMRPVTATGSVSAAEVGPIALGATVLGAGGGGSRKLGLKFAADIASRLGDRVIETVALSALPTDARVAVAARLGTAPPTADSLAAVASAFRRLGEVTGGPLDAVLPGDVGAASSLVPLSVALELGIPVIDASGTGRGASRLTMNGCASRPISPIVLASGETHVQLDVELASTADTTLRSVIGGSPFHEEAGVAMWAMTGAAAAVCCVPDTLSQLREVGLTILAATEIGDPIAAAVHALPGSRLLGRGRIDEFIVSLGHGFDTSTVVIRDGDQSVTVAAHDENLLAWVDGEEAPAVIAPDIIGFIAGDGSPLCTGDLQWAADHDLEVGVVAVPAPAPITTSDVVESYQALCRRMGHSGGYLPFRLP